nr:putative glycerol-3-phosphate transporter 5 [Ipomoea batatas]
MELNAPVPPPLNPPPPLPPGLRFFPALNSPHKTFHQILVFVLTFTAYAAFHASRKPPSIVKSVLGTDPKTLNTTSNASLGWAPFDGPDGTHRLGELDLAFLLSYSAGMYFAGHIGDSIDLRLFLTAGMVGSGFFVVVFGLGYFLDVHWLPFFVVVQILCGLFQSIGWPCVVAVVGNWFGEGRRGFIMGAWNSHTSVGNIVGSLVASSVLGYGWGWSFVLPGAFIVAVAILVYLFLVVRPDDIGFDMPADEGEALVGEDEGEVVRLVASRNEGSVAIGFLEAWKLPGVAPYAFCLFFSKLVAYTFLYWLPFYIRHTGMHCLPFWFIGFVVSQIYMIVLLQYFVWCYSILLQIYHGRFGKLVCLFGYTESLFTRSRFHILVLSFLDGGCVISYYRCVIIYK